jgi:hypothetical protein
MMKKSRTYSNWRKNIKMMWDSPLRNAEKMNDGILECWKNEMIEYWKDMKNSASELVNMIRLDNDLVMLNNPVYVNNNHKAGEY